MAIVYHGGNRFDRHSGYKASNKKGRVEFGVGLYTTTAYEWANLYGRKVHAFSVDLDNHSASHNVFIPMKEIIGFVKENGSIQFYKDFVKNVTDTEMSANRLMNYFALYHKRLHLVAQNLNDFVVAWGAKFTVESGKYGGALVRIHDFSIILEEVKPSLYDYCTNVLDKSLFAGYN